MNNNYMRNANMRNCGCSQQNRNMQQRNAMPAVETYNKNKGLMSIYELGFAMTEALLYLDTHPDDAEAIEYYNSINPQYAEAVADYEERLKWAKKMLINISQAGFFSSDRTIAQYNEDIWKL